MPMDHVNPDGKGLDGEPSKEIAILHAYGQGAQHDDVFLVGNRKALLALRAAIDAALDEGNGFKAATASAFVADGEGFDVHVMLDDSPWSAEFWNKLALPYSADWITNEGANWPEIVMRDRKSQTK